MGFLMRKGSLVPLPRQSQSPSQSQSRVTAECNTRSRWSRTVHNLRLSARVAVLRLRGVSEVGIAIKMVEAVFGIKFAYCEVCKYHYPENEDCECSDSESQRVTLAVPVQPKLPLDG
jgi:hypothetical protein